MQDRIEGNTRREKQNKESKTNVNEETSEGKM